MKHFPPTILMVLLTLTAFWWPVPAARAQEQTLETSRLRLSVTADPPAYTLTDKTSGRVLLRLAQLEYSTTAAQPRYATSLRDLAPKSGGLFAHAYVGAREIGGIRWSFPADDILLAEIGSEAEDVGVLGQHFVDQNERHYGVWESGLGDENLDLRGIQRDYIGSGQTAGASWCNARAPFYLSSAGYGLYASTQAIGRYAFGIDGRTSVRFEGSRLPCLVIAGDYRHVLYRYNQLAGPAVLPPDWALGSVWWRDDNTQPRTIADADALRAQRIHATTILVDRPYTSGTWGWGNFDFGGAYTDGRKLIADLDARGMKTIAWIANRAENRMLTVGRANNWTFPGERPALNLREPAAYRWFQEQLAGLLDMGIAGYKIDRGEEGEMPASYMNEHAVTMARLAYETLVWKRGDDHFIIARNLADTGRRYSAVWNGDTTTSFEGLANSVKHALRCGLMIFPLWGSDTGGYMGPRRTPELMARWMGFSAYTPVMEVLIRDVWPAGPADEALVSIIRDHAATHHQLIPYVRSTLRAGMQTGVGVIRPLLLMYPEDPVTADLADQYLYGDALLVAPVLTAGATERRVYLPAGNWIDYNDRRTVHTGGRWVTVPAPQAVIPVFAREGSIIVRGDVLQANNNWTPDWKPWLRVEVFPPAAGETRFDYFTGQKTLPLTATRDGRRLTIDVPDLGLPTELAVFCPAESAFELNGHPAPATLRQEGMSVVKLPGPGRVVVMLP